MRCSPSLLALALIATACDGGAPTPEGLADAGTEALHSGRYEDAREAFDAALELIGDDARHPRFRACSLGAIEAEVHLNPEKAARELLRLAKAHPAAVRDRDYSQIATLLANARAFAEAIRVLDAGKKAHPGSAQLDEHLARVTKEMQDSGNRAGLAELEGLGYLGDR